MLRGTRSRWLLALVVPALAALAVVALQYAAHDETSAPPFYTRSATPGSGAERDVPRPTLHGTPSAATRSRGGVAGFVREDGRGVAVAVELHRLTTRAAHAPLGWDRPTGYLRRLDPVGPREPAQTTASGRDGSFAFLDVPRGQYQVVALGREGARDDAIVDVPGGTTTVGVDLTLPPDTGVVRGTVRDPDGRLFRGFVRVVPRASWRHYRGQLPGDILLVAVGVDGSFEVRGVPHGLARVHAFRPGELDVTGPEVWVPSSATVDFVAGEHLAWVPGRVLADDDGTPIAGAVLHASLSGSDHRAVSDAEGRFEAAVPTREHNKASYFVRAPGFSRAGIDAETGADEVVVLMTRTGRLRGRVLQEEDGRPVGGVAVLAVPHRAVAYFPWGASAATAADGSFAIPDAPAGQLEVRVRGKGYLLRSPNGALDEGLTTVVPRGGTTSVELRVARAGHRRGRVTNVAGEAVAGALVQVYLEVEDGPFGNDEYPWKYLVVAETTSAEDGTFEVAGLKPGATYTVYVGAPGYVTSSTAGVEVSEEEFRVRLDPGRWLEVLVEGEEGGPLSPAEVHAGVKDGEGIFVPTGPDGRARIGPLPTDTGLAVWASAPGRLGAGAGVEPGAEGVVTVRLPRAHRIAGRVTYQDGSPAKHVEVRIEDRQEEARTNEAGLFEIEDLPGGIYELVARVYEGTSDDSFWNDDWEVVVAKVRARAGDRDVVLRLETAEPDEDDAPPFWPEFDEVKVRVLLPSGVPVPEATIEHRVEGGGASGIVQGGTVYVARDTTSFRIKGAMSASRVPLPVGPYEGGPVPEGVDEVTVRLPPELCIEGRVVDADGEPVAAARAWVSDGRATTGADGRFRIGQLGDMEYELSVFAPYGYLSVEDIVVAAGAKDVSVALQAAARVSITVLDAGGAPLEGATVRVYLPSEEYEGRGPPAWETESKTDAGGRVRPPGLHGGTAYHVSIWPPDHRKDLVGTHVERWRPTDSAFRLERALRVAGVVLDVAGRPVPQVDVNVVHGGVGRISATESDERGRFEVGGLHAGAVTLHASYAGVGAWSRGVPDFDVLSHREGERVTVPAGTKDVTLRIEPGLPLTVEVANWPETRRRHRVTLRPRGASGDADASRRASYTATIDAEGVARFRHAPKDATYTLWVGPVGGDRYALVRDVRPGPRVHRVTLVEGGTIEGTLRGPAEGWRGWVDLEGEDFQVRGKLHRDGSFEVHGVPPGTWTLRAHATARETGDADARGPAREFTGSVQAKPGFRVVIDLQPKR